MKEFRFTLEAVSTLRRRQEQVAVDAYVQCLVARRRAAEAVMETQDKLDANGAEMTRVLSAGCTAAHAFQISNYQRFLEKQREQRLALVAQADQKLGAAFQAMLIARQQREIVETYRKKQQAKHQRLVLREDQKLIDEMAGRRTVSAFVWNSTNDSVL